MIKKLLAFLILASLLSPCFVHAEDKDKDFEKEFYPLIYSGFKTIKSFGYIGVQFGNKEDARKIGLKEDELTDYIKLRFKNNFGKIEYKEVPSWKTLEKTEEERSKIGSLACRVWIVGDDYPIAYHIKCQAGTFKDFDIWKDEALGFGSKSNVPEDVKKYLGEMIEKCAITFFKARGEL